MPRTVNLNHSLLGKSIADRIRKVLGNEVKGLPENGINEDVTDAGDPHAKHIPMSIYPHKGMVTGSGSGPLIGSESRSPSQ